MIETLLESLRNWNKNNSDRAKLQHSYAALTVLVLLTAGVIGLVNYSLGQSMLFIAIISALVFVANAVIWALLQSFVLGRLGPKKRTTTKK